MNNLVERFRNGEQLALARLISVIENEDARRNEVMAQLYPLMGKAYIVGVTGSPGAGKSSLVDRMSMILRKRDETIGIIAVDPSSPFSGGALLGDRIRMQTHALDKGVFIRSMGTRGSLGGLAHTTKDVAKAMDAFGFQWVVIETVGVGQAEIDIMHLADTTIVILTPGAGDSIQTIKAGIMEIADVFAVNKSDLPGADRVATEIETMLDLHCDTTKWRPPVVQVSSVTNMGLENLLEAIENHRQHLLTTGVFQKIRQERIKEETLEIVNHQWQQLVSRQVKIPGRINELLQEVLNRKIDPYTAANNILAHVATSFKSEGAEAGPQRKIM
ncbi:MAG TPA: methylmalonyl Co-A mutase-associated GTPase MeaB [Desulfotomaculum sp.]|nr:methylmalonyl Co-A mutase-associated GTPase MeaB [Desulfotomaculum sp.]